MTNFDSLKSFHLIGIGGIGMSAIAQLLKAKGKRVTGSDIKESKVTMKLRSLGIEIFLGHNRENLRDTQAVIFSSAIREDNPELTEAKSRGIPIFHRAEALAKLVEGRQVIAVTGSSGKTTTTAMIGHVLYDNGLSPTIIVGGWLKRFDSNVVLGSSDIVVLEADESDASLLHITPKRVVVSSISPDVNLNAPAFQKLGPDSENIVRKLREVLLEFIFRADNIALGSKFREIIGELPTHQQKMNNKRVEFFGLDDPDWHLRNIDLNGLTSSADVFYKGKFATKLFLNVPGYHNLLNALATIAILSDWLTIESITSSLGTFEAPLRRFEVMGSYKGALVVDDYAHNPEKISALIKSAKDAFPDKRLVIVYQPHRYTRTLLFSEVLPDALSEADVVIFTPIYSAGEAPIEGVSSKVLFERFKAKYNKEAYLTDSLSQTLEMVKEISKPRDLIITVGAGNIREVAERLTQEGRRAQPMEATHNCALTEKALQLEGQT